MDISRTRYSWRYYAALLISAFLIGTGGVPARAADISEDGESRISRSTEFQGDNRSRGDVVRESLNEHEAMPAEDGQAGKTRTQPHSKTRVATSSSPSFDFWFYDADVELFNDDDRDGYFYGIDLWFDADTIYGVADVYAVMYLSLDGGPWSEYAVTEDFVLFGTTGTDDYVVVTELIDGYPTGSYDILIELFDAFDDSFLASFGPADTSELAFLPLEDSRQDAPQISPQPIVVNTGGGGSSGFLTLVLLGLAGYACRRQPSAVI